MNLFKVQCIPPQSWEFDQQPQQWKKNWTCFPTQQTDQNSYISEINLSKMDYFNSNPEILFEQIMISFQKQYSIDQQVTRISNSDEIRFKLELNKPQFCMGAFTHNKQPLYNQLSPNIVTPSPEQYRPFTNIITSQYRSSSSYSFNSSFSSIKHGQLMDQQSSQIEFNKILSSQSKYFKGAKLSNIFSEKVSDSLWHDNYNNEYDNVMSIKASNIFNRGHNQLGKNDNIIFMKDQLRISTIDHDQQQQRVNQRRAFQLGLIQINQQQKEVSFVKQQGQKKQKIQCENNYLLQQRDENDIIVQLPQQSSQSIFTHYTQLLTYQPSYDPLPAWQQSVILPSPSNDIISHQFQISQEWHQSQLSLFESHFSISNEAMYIIPESRLFVLIGEMLVGVENKLFLLDYDTCEWYVDLRGVRFQYILRESLIDIVHQQLVLANMLSRLRKFIQFSKQRSQRMIYFQISKVVETTLQVFESYLLELTQQHQQISITTNTNNNNGMLQFLTSLSQLRPQIHLLYNLIIWQQQITRQNLSYMNFTYKFIRSQFQLYQTIIKLTKQADQLQPKYNHLLRILFNAVFKPILMTLNKILFESIDDVTRKQEMYLKYYFQSVKELISATSKKITLIYKQSPQLYLVCKQRLNLTICFNLDNLKFYDQSWSQLFYQKFINLQHILNQMIQNQNEDKNNLQKKRKLQLQILKQKLNQRSIKQKTLKQQQRDKKLQEMERLKKQIKQKQQRNKLQVLIEKQRQRGYLLQGELRNKIMLLKQKDRLLEQLPQENIITGQLNKTTSLIQQIIVQTIDKKQQYQDNIISQVQSQHMIEQIITPITNTINLIMSQVVGNDDNNNKILLDDDNNSDNKQYRTRKIKKITSINSLKHKKQINNNYNNNKLTGTIITQLSYELIDDSRPIIQKQISSKLTKFRELCQKSKHLNFQPLTGSMMENQQERQQVRGYLEEEEELDDENENEQNNNYDDTIQQMQNRKFISSSSSSANNTNPHPYTGTTAILDICIDKVIQNQMQVVTNCYQIIIFQKYHLKQIIKFMKATFLSENGQKQHNLLSVGCSIKTSRISLKSFTECSLLDNLPHFISQLKPSFYHTQRQPHYNIPLSTHQSRSHNPTIPDYYSQLDIISSNLDQQIGFQFTSMPLILQPYFSYIHLSKYMQIFAFLLRIKHCEMIVSQLWLTLNDFKQSIFNNNKIYLDNNYNTSRMNLFAGEQWQFQSKLLNQLFIVRHLIQSFLKTYQNYIFFRVIEKQFKILNKRIDKHQMNQLEISHEKILDSIIRNAFVDNNTNNITKQIRNLLELVRQFAQIVQLLCENNILQDQREQVMNKVKFIHQHFKHNHKFFEALYFKT